MEAPTARGGRELAALAPQAASVRGNRMGEFPGGQFLNSSGGNVDFRPRTAELALAQ